MAPKPHSDKPYLIGVIGDQTSLMSFWDMLKDRAAPDSLSKVGLVAAALPGESNASGSTDMGFGMTVYQNFRAMLDAHPEINMLVDTTGNPETLKILRHGLPPTVTLVERAAASFFVHLLATENMWMACQVDLSTTQTMLRAIIDQLHEEILFLDREGLILNANQTACTAADKSPREMVGHHFSEVFRNLEEPIGPSGPVEDCDCPFQRTLITGEASESMSGEVDGEGRMRYFRVYMYPIFEGDALNRVVAMRRDITKRTEMENRLHQTQKLASIGELSTYIAHEIRNPLFAISGFANSLLRTGDLSDATEKKLGIILEESRRLDATRKNIVDFARPVETPTSSADVNHVARTTMDVMGLACSDLTIKSCLELGEDLPRAKMDEDLLKQCLINLVKNGMEAMPSGGMLTVSTRLTQTHVTLDVSDTGPGIPAEIRDKIFNPFFSTKGQGTGLGLAMIKKIMDDIGGDVELKTGALIGTTVTLLLPPVLAVADSEKSG